MLAGNGMSINDFEAGRGHRCLLLGHVESGQYLVRPLLVTVGPGTPAFMNSQDGGIRFIYVLSGAMTYRYGVETSDLHPGDSMLFMATTEHGPEAVGGQPVCYLSVSFRLSR